MSGVLLLIEVGVLALDEDEDRLDKILLVVDGNDVLEDLADVGVFTLELMFLGVAWFESDLLLLSNDKIPSTPSSSLLSEVSSNLPRKLLGL